MNSYNITQQYFTYASTAILSLTESVEICEVEEELSQLRVHCWYRWRMRQKTEYPLYSLHSLWYCWVPKRTDYFFKDFKSLLNLFTTFYCLSTAWFREAVKMSESHEKDLSRRVGSIERECLCFMPKRSIEEVTGSNS